MRPAESMAVFMPQKYHEEPHPCRVLVVVVAAERGLPELYALVVLSAALKVVVLPLLVRRPLRGTVGGCADRLVPHAADCGGMAGRGVELHCDRGRW